MFLEWENNSGKLQIISGKFQNNAINDVKQISLSHVIIKGNPVKPLFNKHRNEYPALKEIYLRQLFRNVSTNKDSF